MGRPWPAKAGHGIPCHANAKHSNVIKATFGVALMTFECKAGFTTIQIRTQLFSLKPENGRDPRPTTTSNPTLPGEVRGHPPRPKDELG